MDYDIVIVGGGILGTSVAYLMSRGLPNWRIVLVEQSSVGSGASEPSAGFDAIESPNSAHRDLATRSRALYREMSSDVPAAAVQSVITYWIVDKKNAPSFKGNFVTKSGNFSQIDLVSNIEFQDFHIGPQKSIVRDVHNGYARPGDVCRGIVSHLRHAHDHFTCWEGVEAVAITTHGSFAVTHLRDGRNLCAKHVFLAAGAWLLRPQLAALAPESPRLRSKKIGSLCIESAPAPSAPALVFYEEGAFLLPLHDERRWIFNFTLDVWGCSPETVARTLEPAELEYAMGLLSKLAPDLAPHVGGAKVAIDLYTPDRMPVVYSPAAMPRVAIATGCSGAGYRIAPALAEDMVRRVRAPVCEVSK